MNTTKENLVETGTETNESYTILIVDDMPSNLQALYQILKDNYTIKTANSGELALKKIQTDKPDLILMDIVMPGMNGYDVLAQLKESGDTHYIPIIFITGLTESEDEAKGLFMGAVDYITKPFNENIVRARVRTHLQIVRQMRLIEKLGMLDALTGLANRRKFDQTMENEWERAKRDKSPISLLALDVDKFKSYNDTYGHPAGDLLLQKLGKVLSDHARRPADLAARIGGEEFVILYPGVDLNNAIKLGEKVRAAVEALMIPSGIDPSLPVTVSIGVGSMVPDFTDRASNFIDACDQKLYTAKETGRNKISY